MKLIGFRCVKLNGYLDLDFKFFEDITFLTGVNGSGKTTVMNILDSLFNVRFDKIMELNFLIIEISYKESGRSFTCFMSKENSCDLVVKIKDDDELRDVAYLKIENCEHILEDFADEDDYQSYFNGVLKNNEVVKIIISLPRMVFMNINRKYFSNELLERELYGAKRRYVAGGPRKNTIDLSLSDAKRLIMEEYRISRIQIDKLEEKLKKQLLKDSFITADYKQLSMSELKKNLKESLHKYAQNKEDFLSHFKIIYGDDNDAITRIRNFYESLVSMLMELDKTEESAITLELVLNYAQVARINLIEAAIKEYKDHKTKTLRKINIFLETMNFFLMDSRKQLKIDQIGRLLFFIDGLDKPAGRMSSGEMHLVIIFALLILDKKKFERETVFVIDEPELSMHLRWQKYLIEKILAVSKKNIQFVFATHSPEILGDHDERQISLTPKSNTEI